MVDLKGVTKNFATAGNQTDSPSDSLSIGHSPFIRNLAPRIGLDDIERGVNWIKKVIESAIRDAPGFDREGWNWRTCPADFSNEELVPPSSLRDPVTTLEQ
jgi:hypothetical protein